MSEHRHIYDAGTTCWCGVKNEPPAPAAGPLVQCSVCHSIHGETMDGLVVGIAAKHFPPGLADMRPHCEAALYELSTCLTAELEDCHSPICSMNKQAMGKGGCACAVLPKTELDELRAELEQVKDERDRLRGGLCKVLTAKHWSLVRDAAEAALSKKGSA